MKNFIFVSILFAIISLVSCQQNTVEFEAVQTQDQELTSQSYTNSIDVSEDMLQQVIASKRPDGCASRSDGYTISSIKGIDGTPMVYVINFDNNGGFMLISAKLSYHPVLAYSEEGNYKVEDKESNIAFYQDILVNNVELSTKMPEDSIKKYRQEWLQYKTSPKKIISRARPDDAWPEYWDETDYQNYEIIRHRMMDTLSVLFNKTGYRFYFPDDPDPKFDVDPAVLELALNACQGAVFYRYEDIWKKVSLIVYRPFDSQIKIPNFLETLWHQESPFNEKMPINKNTNKPFPTGCWTVAAGQVMYYYNWPNTIFWANMNYEGGNHRSTKEFLAKLATDAKCVTDKKENRTHINQDDMLKALRNIYQYKTSSHKLTHLFNCIDYIFDKKPVIISGNNKNNGKGHAWIASGLDYAYYGAYLDVYTAVQPTKFVKDSSFIVYQNERRLLYMNWGWESANGNGFYSLDNLNPSDKYYEPNSLEYIIIEPNK